MQTLEAVSASIIDRNAQIVAWFQFGMSADLIAKDMNLNPQIVRNALSMAGVAFTNDPRNDD